MVTPRDVGDPGPAGRVVRVVVSCHPIGRSSGGWLVVDLSGSSGPGCVRRRKVLTAIIPI